MVSVCCRALLAIAAMQRRFYDAYHSDCLVQALPEAHAVLGNAASTQV